MTYLEYSFVYLIAILILITKLPYKNKNILLTNYQSNELKKITKGRNPNASKTKTKSNRNTHVRAV